MKNSKSILLVVMCLLPWSWARSQETKSLEIKAGADLVSNYVWRGSPSYSVSGDGSSTFLSPNFQPVLGVIYRDLEVGAWASTDFSGTYKETDLYVTYSKAGFSLTLNDYYWDAAWLAKPFFDYNSETTGHILEGVLGWKSEKIPFGVTVSTMFFGADKKFDKATGAFDLTKNNYSTYLEFVYGLHSDGDQKLDLSLGLTPSDGYYGDGYGGNTGFGVVNIGLSGTRNLKWSENFGIPLKTAFILNPMHEKAYLVFGLSF